MNDNIGFLLHQGAVGEDAREFMTSQLGRTILELAALEAKQAMDELKKINTFENPAKATVLQERIKMAEYFGAWLAEIYARGRVALSTYDRNQDAQGDSDGQADETGNDADEQHGTEDAQHATAG